MAEAAYILHSLSNEAIRQLECVRRSNVSLLSYLPSIFTRNSGLEQEAFVALHNSVKRGDIVGVEGYPGKSKMGELSIFPRKFVVLSPCLHMPPTVRSGLKDQVLPVPSWKTCRRTCCGLWEDVCRALQRISLAGEAD